MADTANADSFWQKRVVGKEGLFGHLGQHGVGDTLKQNFKWETGNKGMVFARGAATTVGAVMAYSAIANDKTADGEERSMLARLTQFIVGTGIAAAGLLAGKGK